MHSLERGIPEYFSSDKGQGGSRKSAESEEPKKTGRREFRGRGPGFGGARPERQPLSDDQDDRLGEALRRLGKGFDVGASFELQLMSQNLMSRLENAGIFSVIENPNPFDPEIDEESHERWWKEHPQQATEFRRNMDERSETLRHLYIGALIGSGPWPIP